MLNVEALLAKLVNSSEFKTVTHTKTGISIAANSTVVAFDGYDARIDGYKPLAIVTVYIEGTNFQNAIPSRWVLNNNDEMYVSFRNVSSSSLSGLDAKVKVLYQKLGGGTE